MAIAERDPDIHDSRARQQTRDNPTEKHTHDQQTSRLPKNTHNAMPHQTIHSNSPPHAIQSSAEDREPAVTLIEHAIITTSAGATAPLANRSRIRIDLLF